MMAADVRSCMVMLAKSKPGYPKERGIPILWRNRGSIARVTRHIISFAECVDFV
jgi:hypothetical protein